jgi:hypothetical protein
MYDIKKLSFSPEFTGKDPADRQGCIFTIEKN